MIEPSNAFPGQRNFKVRVGNGDRRRDGSVSGEYQLATAGSVLDLLLAVPGSRWKKVLRN